MPPAGEIPAHRAIAHLRWAERYNGLGDVRKATSHTERGLDYIRLSTGFGARRAEFSNIKETNADQGWHEAKLDGRSVEITIRKTDDGGAMVKVYHTTGIRAPVKITVIPVRGTVDDKTLRRLDPLALRVHHHSFQDDMSALYEAARNSKDKRIACVIIENPYGSYPEEEPERVEAGMRLTEAAVALLKKRSLIADESLVVVRAADESESDELLRHKLEKGGYKPLGDYMMFRKAGSAQRSSRSSITRVPQTRSQSSRTRSGKRPVS
jgi:hypothetical protein